MAPPTLQERKKRLTTFATNTGARSQPASPRKNGNYDGAEQKRATSELPVPNAIENLKVPVPQTAQPRQLELEEEDDLRSVQASDFEYQESHDAQNYQQHRIQYVLEGSELGDSFMNSRVSTPSVASHFDVRPPQSHRDANGRHRSRRYGNGGERHGAPAFEIGEDMFMSVVSAPRRHTAAEMRDGFSTAILPEYDEAGRYTPTRESRQKPHRPQPTKLPLREVRVNRNLRSNNHEPKHRGRDTSRQDENRSAASHSNSPVLVPSDESGSSQDEEDLQSTPTGKPARKPSRRPAAQRHDVSNQALAGSPVRQAAEQNKRRRLNNLDYDDAALSAMSYQDLVSEPFDFDPAVAAASRSPAVSTNDGNQKLEQFRLAGPTEQQEFFANMSVDEWESAGDWFAQEFTGIMKKLREARRSKRHVIDEFEQEAAAREGAVREQSDRIDRKLQRMREDGLRVVGEKASQR